MRVCHWLARLKKTGLKWFLLPQCPDTNEALVAM